MILALLLSIHLALIPLTLFHCTCWPLATCLFCGKTNGIICLPLTTREKNNTLPVLRAKPLVQTAISMLTFQLCKATKLNGYFNNRIHELTISMAADSGLNSHRTMPHNQLGIKLIQTWLVQKPLNRKLFSPVIFQTL